MKRPVCTECLETLVTDKIGITVMETIDGEDFAVWQCDRFKCPGCDMTVFSGWGNGPIAKIYEAGDWGFWRDQAEWRFKG